MSLRKHQPYLCQKCHGPISAKYGCTDPKCNNFNRIGRPFVTQPSKAGGGSKAIEAEEVNIDYKGRNDAVGDILTEGFEPSELQLRENRILDEIPLMSVDELNSKIDVDTNIVADRHDVITRKINALEKRIEALEAQRLGRGHRNFPA